MLGVAFRRLFCCSCCDSRTLLACRWLSRAGIWGIKRHFTSSLCDSIRLASPRTLTLLVVTRQLLAWPSQVSSFCDQTVTFALSPFLSDFLSFLTARTVPVAFFCRFYAVVLQQRAVFTGVYCRFWSEHVLFPLLDQHMVKGHSFLDDL